MSEVIKEISVSHTYTITETWTVILDPKDENNKSYVQLISKYRKDKISEEGLYEKFKESYLQLIEDFRQDKLSKEELYYGLADSSLATCDEDKSHEEFRVIIKE
jgi:hypothetical protein